MGIASVCVKTWQVYITARQYRPRVKDNSTAHLHFRRDVYKSGGKQASARLEYITGRTVATPDMAQRQLRYLKEGREDLVEEHTRNLPDWANGNPHTYFQAAERYEGGGEKLQYTAFEEWKITLPQELSHEQNRVLVEDLIDMIAGDRLPCTYAFHDPLTLDGTQRQPHIHLLISARITGSTDEYQRPVAQHFKRWNSKEPGQGGAQKDPAFWHKGAVKNHRLMISDILNVHLEVNGQVARVHPDTLESRGIDRKPEPKLLPSESRAYRDKGEISDTMAEVLKVRETRGKQREKERNNARQYWEQRKAFLGITREMSREAKVAHILYRRHGEVERVPARYRPLVEHARVRSPQRQPQQARPSVQQRLAQLAAQLDREETHGHGKLRVRLHDDAQERGVSW